MKGTTIHTEWDLATYDVWGNAREGYDVNDVYRQESFFHYLSASLVIELDLEVTINNAGTPHEFTSAYPSDRQIRQAFGLRAFQLDLAGDDLTIYINRARDGYPIGELRCISHKSLSPIQEVK